MRTSLLLVWLTIPVLVGAYHLGPGQQRMLLDDTAAATADAGRHVDREQWSDALVCYDTALGLLPSDRVDQRRRLQLERAKVKMMAAKLPEAHQELIGLVDELRADDSAEPALVAEAQAALANSRYYVTWLMRLEGASREEWEPEIEASRQTFRSLAEQAQDTDDVKRYTEDLEASIRLARMDLSDLQGLPLPSQ